MSFASGVKDDLTRVLSSKPCCRKAELAAFLRLHGNVRAGEDGLSLSMRTENAAVARKIFTLAKSCGLETQLNMPRKASSKHNQRFSLRIAAQPLLAELSVSDEECCRRSYLRGAFLAAGYINHPEGAYHLELSLPDLRQALFIQKLLYDFEVRAKLIRRKGLFILYLKEGEQISLFLNIVGSHRSMLEFESTRVDKEIRNKVNRLVNCDKANLDKTVEAAFKQIECIRLLEREKGLNRLPPTLRDVALLRLQHPEASLSELSDISGLGRSAVNHRLRRLQELADELEAGAWPI